MLGPIVWNLIHLSILYDIVGTSSLILTAWITRKPGASFIMGLVTTILNFFLVPGSFNFLGFTVASAVFDFATSIYAYRGRFSGEWLDELTLIGLSVLSGLAAGAVIGPVFMGMEGVSFFTILHGFGGLLGGILGVNIAKALEIKNIPVYRVEKHA
jgi:hypothetical protein